MKKLRNLLLTSVAMASIGCATLDKKIQSSYLDNAEMLVQNSGLIYEDVFKSTKSLLQEHGCKEANPIGALFFKNNKWGLYYLTSVGAEILINSFAYQIDETGDTAKILNGAFALIEVLVIKSNREILFSLGDKTEYAPLNIEILRINY